MTIQIHHALPGRLRVHYDKSAVDAHQAVLAQTLLSVQEGISSVQCNTTVGSYLIHYDEEQITRAQIENLFKALDESYLCDEKLLATVADLPAEESVWGVLLQTLLWHYVKKLLFPLPLRRLILLKNILPRIAGALYSALTDKFFSTDLLDAAALSVSVLTGDYDTASTVSMLLNMGDDIEEITKRKSYNNLARTLLLSDESVHVLDGDEERTVAINAVRQDDLIIVRAGSQIPADGPVVRGEGLVNQSSITGESLPVEKAEGSFVFAGTILSEGELVIRVKSTGKDTKVSNIISMIDNSQSLKAQAQKRSENFAQKIVPYNFLLTALTWLVTRNVTKTISTLMVDYSCAMKLAAPISVLSAMQEAAALGISVKGGVYLEAVAQADTVVFDKTGTLTYATPKLMEIHALGSFSEEEILRTAACLEEHFPHPLGRAVVDAAEERGLHHPEKHSKVEYIVAHGIASTIDGKKVRIGSAHFIFDDENVPRVPEAERMTESAAALGRSLLYLAYDGELAGILAIGDPVRPDARESVASLKRLGLDRCVMITGDTDGAARKTAGDAGLDGWRAQALPEDKVDYVKSLIAEGAKVIMIGDGINDAPALAAASVGISIDGASSIAGDSADINLSHDGLASLVTTRVLGTRLLRKMRDNDIFILAFNSFLLVGGIVGFIPPTLAALLHNGSTLGISLAAMRPLLSGKR